MKLLMAAPTTTIAKTSGALPFGSLKVIAFEYPIHAPSVDE
jgi:hypothetical protein